MTTKRKAINYLSNSELLHELNESKKSYCYFVDPKYSNYTVIVHDLSEITEQLVEEAIQAKVAQVNSKLVRKYIIDGVSKVDMVELLKDNKVTTEHITKEDLVFRMMTFDHIPEDVQKEKKTLLNRIHFPPFKHYAFVDDELKEVGRSHWVNGLDNGHYSPHHGKTTNNLAKAIMKLVDRYGSKANFSAYSYLADMKGQAMLQLSLVILQFDESKSLNVFSWMTSCTHTAFLKVLKNEKKQRNIRDDLLQEEAGISSYSYQMDHED